MTEEEKTLHLPGDLDERAEEFLERQGKFLNGALSFCVECGARVSPYYATGPIEDVAELVDSGYLHPTEGCREDSYFYFCSACGGTRDSPSRRSSGKVDDCGHFVPKGAIHCPTCGRLIGEEERANLGLARFEQALRFAFERRKGEGPDRESKAHCLGVAALVLETNGDDDEVVAAVLHEVGADRREQVPALFGGQVAEILDDGGHRFLGFDVPIRERVHHAVDFFLSLSPSRQLLRLACKVETTRLELRRLGAERSPDHHLWLVEEFLPFQRGIADALLMSDRSPLAEELDRLVTEIERLST